MDITISEELPWNSHRKVYYPTVFKNRGLSLPPKINVLLLCGLWYSEDKPSNSAIHTFLRPLMTFLNHMYQEGKYSPYGTHITLLEVASQAEIRECNIYPTLFA